MADTNNTLPFNALKTGYILLPKAMLNEAFSMTNREFSDFEAFLMILTKVNYMDSVANIHGYKINCQRGETLISFEKWGNLFHWKRHKTREFFDRMEKMNLLRIISTNKYNCFIIRVVNYDLWASKPTGDWEKRKTKSEEMFEKFWEEYHEVTQTRKRNIGAARREWNKLSESERKMAIENIYSYYMGQDDIRYLKLGCNYLKDKSYFNEEIY